MYFEGGKMAKCRLQLLIWKYVFALCDLLFVSLDDADTRLLDPRGGMKGSKLIYVCITRGTVVNFDHPFGLYVL